jgi:lysophospholipase L1-like esterase
MLIPPVKAAVVGPDERRRDAAPRSQLAACTRLMSTLTCASRVTLRKAGRNRDADFEGEFMTITLETGTRVMVTGDSITDCERTVGENPLGYGYPLRVAGQWGLRHPDRQPVWLNTGISGNRVSDLTGRWQADVLDARPDVVSILVGINDCGLHYSLGFDKVTTEEYRDGYRRLLEPLAERGVKLILIEPFLLPVAEDQYGWRPDLDAKIQVVRRLADEFDAHLIAADGMFAGLAATSGNATWAADGVHPTAAGHAALAEAWLGQVG